MKFTDFSPANHGFMFPNMFSNHVSFLNLFKITTNGRCGGMVYAALDYFNAQRRIPNVDWIPPDGDALADYIMDRQITSLSDVGLKFLARLIQQATPHIILPLIGGITPGLSVGDQFQGGIDETDGIAASIEEGRPIMLVLMSMDFDPTGNHQVLAIGYEDGVDRQDRSIAVYDPNHPGEITILKPDRAASCFTDQFGKSWRTLFSNDNYDPSDPPMASTPAQSQMLASSRLTQHMDLFWVDPAGAVTSAWSGSNANGGTWNAIFPITAAGSAVRGSPVAVQSRLPHHVDTFWVNGQGAVCSAWWNRDANNGGWNPPFEVTLPGVAYPGAPIAAVSRLPHHVDLFWVNGEGAVWSAWWNRDANGGNWSAPFAITPPGAVALGGYVSAVARLPHHVDVFWVNNQGEVNSAWWDRDANNGVWTPPFSVTPAGFARPGAQVAAVARLPHHVDVFWVNQNGAVYSAWWSRDVNSGIWNAPFPISRVRSARRGTAIAAVARLPNHMDVFWVGSRGAVISAWWNPGAGWSDTFAITAPHSVRPGSQVSAVSPLPHKVSAFWVDDQGAVSHSWWDRDMDSGNWIGPLQITPPGASG